MIDPQIEPQWKEQLFDAFQTASFERLKTFLVEDRKQNTIFPPAKLIFNAFNLTPFGNVKVVIIGQDPYHGEGQAHGLCFSVPEGIQPPPSLVNIFKEISRDFGYAIPASGNLEKWAKQGVLLLNATLTVRAHQAGSHQGKGWEEFTDVVIQRISDHLEGVVFLLWGNYAQAKASLIDTQKHCVLKTVHPSPLSAHRGFIGCGHFSKTNEYLLSLGKEPIDWKL